MEPQAEPSSDLCQLNNAALVILAGGEGRRIGGNKPLQSIGDRRLIDIAIAKARQWTARIAVSVRSPEQLPDLLEEKILDARIEGPLGGLLSAFDWGHRMKACHVLIVPCDAPGLPTDLMLRLHTTSVEAGAAAFARSVSGDHPTCALWPLSAREKVNDYCSGGGQSLRGALAVCDAIAVDWVTEPDTDPFFNINTSGDLSHWIAHRS